MSALLAQRVRPEAAALPVALRQAIVFAYLGGHSQRRVAALSGIPAGAAKARSAPRRLAAALRMPDGAEP